MTGFIRKLHPTFGFLNSGATTYFFHGGSCAAGTLFEDLRPGAEVEFEIKDGDPRGPQAVNIQLLSE